MADALRDVQFNISDLLGESAFKFDPQIGEEARLKKTGKRELDPVRGKVEIERMGGKADFGEGLIAGAAEAVADFSVGAVQELKSVIAFVPDTILNTIQKRLAQEGYITEKEMIPDVIDRIINKGDYETYAAIKNSVEGAGFKIGAGEKLGFQKGAGKVGEVAALFGSFALPQGAVAKGISQFFYGGARNAKNAFRIEGFKAIQRAEQKLLSQARTAAEKRAIKQKFKTRRKEINNELNKYKFDKETGGWKKADSDVVIPSKKEAQLAAQKEMVEEAGGDASVGFLRSLRASEAKRITDSPLSYLKKEAAIGAGIGTAYEGLAQTTNREIADGALLTLLGAGLFLPAASTLGKKAFNWTLSGRAFNAMESKLGSAASQEGTKGKAAGAVLNWRDKFIGKPKPEEIGKARRTVSQTLEEQFGQAEAVKNRQFYDFANARLQELGFEPLTLTTAEITMSPTVLAQQRVLAQKMGPEKAQKELARYQSNMEKLDEVARSMGLDKDTLENVVKYGDEPDSLIILGAGEQQKRAINRIERWNQKLGKTVAEAEAKLSRGEINIEEAGEILRNTVAGAKESAKEWGKNRAKELGINIQNPMVKDTELMKMKTDFIKQYAKSRGISIKDIPENNLIQEYLNKNGRFGETNDVVRKFLERDLKDVGGQKSIDYRFNNYLDDTENISIELNRLYNSQGSRITAKQQELTILKDNLQKLTERFGARKAGDAQTPLNYQKFLKEYDEIVTQPFANDVIQRMIRKSGDFRTVGDPEKYVTAAEKIAGKFLENTQNAKLFNEQFSGVTGSQKIVDDVLEKAGEDGLQTEFNQVGKLIQEYVQTSDRMFLDAARRNPEYKDYATVLKNIINKAYPDGKIPVYRREGYATGKAGPRVYSTINADDVIFIGGREEAEIIARTGRNQFESFTLSPTFTGKTSTVNTEVQGLMRDVLLREIKMAGVLDDAGKINIQKIKNYINKKEPVLRELKIIDDAGIEVSGLEYLNNTKKVFEGLRKRQENVKKLTEAANRDILFAQFNKLNFPKNYIEDKIGATALLKGEGKLRPYSGEDIINAGVKDAIENNNFQLLKRLQREIKSTQKSKQFDPGELEREFNRVLMQKLASRKGKFGFDNPEKFQGLLNQNENLLRDILGNKHFDDLTMLNTLYLRTVKQLDVSPLPEQVFQAGDIIRQIARLGGVTPQGLSARSIAIIENRSGLRTAGVWLIGQAIRARQGRVLDQVMEEAIYNKEFAALMNKEIKGVDLPMGGIDPKLAKDLRKQLLLLGIVDPSEIEVGGQKITPAVEVPNFKSQPELELSQSTPSPPPPTRKVTPPPVSTQPPVINKIPPAPPTQTTSTTPFEVLFPNDPLGQVIANRKKGGIGSLA